MVRILWMYFPPDYRIATPGMAATAVAAAVYKERRFSDHAPLSVDYSGDIPLR